MLEEGSEGTALSDIPQSWTDPRVYGVTRSASNNTVDVDERDMKALIDYEKLPGSILNAFGTALKAKATDEGSDIKCCFLSSWIGAIAAGVVEDGGNTGSIASHTLAAVSVKRG